MSLTKRLKSLGSPIKDAATAYAGYTVAGAKDMIPTTGTVKGAAHGDVGDIAKIGISAALVYGGARGLRQSATMLRATSSEAGLASRIAKTPLKLPVRDPEAAIGGGIKNRVMAGIRSAEAEFNPFADHDPARTKELTGKIKAIRGELRDMGARPSNMSQLKRAGDPKVNPSERGALRFPAGSPKHIQEAHMQAPKDKMMLYTAEKGGGLYPDDGAQAFSRPPNTNMKPSKVRNALMQRAADDVRSGRARLAGFYEKVKDEKGWVRAVDKPAVTKTSLSGLHKTPAHTEIRFGEGKFPGESALGEGPLKKGFYEASVMGSKEKGAVKVAWLKRTGNPGNVARPVEAVVKGLKARGISAIEHEPLSDSRSRLFARQLRKMGLRNIDRNAPDIKKKKPSLASGWGR